MLTPIKDNMRLLSISYVNVKFLRQVFKYATECSINKTNVSST